jgi:hypothetical protein
MLFCFLYRNICVRKVTSIFFAINDKKSREIRKNKRSKEGNNASVDRGAGGGGKESYTSQISQTRSSPKIKNGEFEESLAETRFFVFASDLKL